jgi:2-oxo-hept-3-ene-1,7-dioate hydratase
MQSAVGIDEPDYGVLFDDMFWNDGCVIPFEKYVSPHRGGTRLRAGKTARRTGLHDFDVLDATSYVNPALEILESRMHRLDPETKATRKVTDTISDNAANAAIVTGGRPFRPQDVDLHWVSALLFRNGQIEQTGFAAGVLNNPAHGVAWLANRVAPHGERLEAGEVVLSGSFTPRVDVRKGDTFHADYGPYGSVSCHFA